MTTDYRYPTERRTFWLTLVVAALVVGLLTPITLGWLAVLLVGGLGYRMLTVHWHVKAIRDRADPVTRHPRVAALVTRCRERLDLRQEVEVYVEDRPVANAYAIGLGEPYVVVIYTGLIERLDDDELASVIGHELGHVKFGHTRMLALIGQAGSQSFGAGLLGLLLRQFVFLFWRRATEFTADRAGLVACGSLEKAISTELKLAWGDGWREVDMDALVQRYREHDVGLGQQLGSMMSTHPDVYARLDRLIDFYFSDLYGS